MYVERPDSLCFARFMSYDITGLFLPFTSALFFRFPVSFHDLLRYPLNISTRCGTPLLMYIIPRYS